MTKQQTEKKEKSRIPGKEIQSTKQISRLEEQDSEVEDSQMERPDRDDVIENKETTSSNDKTGRGCRTKRQSIRIASPLSPNHAAKKTRNNE
jgi:hypothetical protein